MKKQLLWCAGLTLLGADVLAQTIPFTRVARSGAFELPDAVSVYPADANGDGYNDLITTGQYAGALNIWYWNPGEQKYYHQNIGGFNYSNGVWANLDGNGTPDALVTQDGNKLHYMMNNFSGGGGQIANPEVAGVSWVGLAGVQAVDFDNDGDDDVVVGKYENGADLFVFRNDEMNFVLADTVKSVFGAGNARIQEIKAADVDNDGFVDLIVPNTNGGSSTRIFAVLKNENGSGVFSVMYYGEVGHPAFGRWSIQTGDLNNDGWQDIAMATYTGVANLGTWINQGSFSFVNNNLSFPTKNAAQFSLADYNQDGNLDYAYFEGYEQDTAGVILGNGDGTFQETFAYLNLQDNGYYQGQQLSYDVNGDGKIDMVNRNAVHFNNIVVPQGWVMDVTAFVGELYAEASFGMSNLASNGLDTDLDVPEPPLSAGAQVRAFFHRPDWEGAISDTYLSDIRQLRSFESGPAHWVLWVKSDVTGTANLNFDRPNGFDAPVNVRIQGEWHYFDGSEPGFGFELDLDADEAVAVQIWVGDNTGPDLFVDEQAYGPAIWDAGQDKEMTVSAEDVAGVSFLVFSVSRNGGETWEVVYDSNELTGKRVAGASGKEHGHGFIFETPESWGEIENVIFRMKAMDNAGNFTNWVGDEFITVGRDTQTLPIGTGWNMMAASLGDANGIELANAFRFAWSGTGYDQTQGYSTFLGHWAGSYEPAQDVVTGSVVTGYAGDGADVWVASGWTMIANPLLRHVSIDELMVMLDEEGAEPVSFATAVENDWVLPVVYGYHPANGYYMAQHFMPNHAYWVGTYEGLALRFVIHGQEMQPTKQAAPAPRMVLSLVDGKARMSFGLTLEAGRDIPAPPSAPGTSEAGFAGAKTILGSLYAEKSIAAGARSENTLQVGGAHREVTLNWTGMTLPGLRSYIVAPDGRQHDLSADGSLTWNTSAGMPVVVTEPISTSNDDRTNLPSALTLHQNYPNPFNPATTLSFAMPAAGQVKLTVMNMLGQNVATVVNGMMPAGSHAVSFDASKLSSGVYLYRLEAAGQTITKRMTLVK